MNKKLFLTHHVIVPPRKWEAYPMGNELTNKMKIIRPITILYEVTVTKWQANYRNWGRLFVSEQLFEIIKTDRKKINAVL